MLYFVDGNLFESPAKTLVNTVNTVGAMGKGLAKEFKRLFPDMFREYQALCEKHEVRIGKLWLWKTENKQVLNFPTKESWRSPSKLEYIEKGLQAFVEGYRSARIESVAFPQLGCGNGELEWDLVRPMMERYLRPLPIEVLIYLKMHTVLPEHRDLKEMRRWLTTQPEYLPFVELKDDLEKLIRDQGVIRTMHGSETRLAANEAGIELANSDGSARIPWEGDETGSGVLEMWQSLRQRGVVTVTDLVHMGLPLADVIIELLMQLPYIRRLDIRDDPNTTAVHLRPQSGSQLPLFSRAESIEQNTN